MVLVKIDRVGSYELDESFTDLLDELVADVIAGSEGGDLGTLRERLEDLTCLVVAAGEPVSTRVAPSDGRQIPRVDASPAEARARLQGFAPAVAA